ncbi:hypothetical protein FE257_007487 [Aspergillus nanangensis]|uniref:NACHT domain-containing protein n=1 Tax=Aspergillus nanangensis TaxID=2582783 RepID=A0AAD4GU53_ASPNN|nr:hypothetical protein FE257_007487 [Aspergillus nanangensis]
MGIRHRLSGLSVKGRPNSARSAAHLPADEEVPEVPGLMVEKPLPVARGVWDEAYVQLKNDPATAEAIGDYERILIAALRPISPEHAYGLDRNPSHWVAHLDDACRVALIEALVTRGCDAFERSSYGRKMLSFVALSIDKMKSTAEGAVEICPASSTAWLAACLIIAPVIINNARKVDASQQGVNYIVSRMPWYTELTKIANLHSWKTPDLQETIAEMTVEIYKQLIRYLLACGRFYDHSSYRFAPNRAKWDDWAVMVSDIKSAEDRIEAFIQAHTGKPVKRALGEAAKQGETIRSIISVFSVAQRRANLMDKIMPDVTLLNPDTYQDYVNQIALPHIETGQGVLSHPTFTSWARGDSGLLVLSGQPGTGKSVLAKCLLQELPRAKATSLCSFFFKDGGEQNNLNTAMYEVLHAVLRQCSRLDAVEEKAEKATRHSVRPDSDLFWEILETAGQDATHDQVTIVLDAMDECKNVHLATALQMLNTYQAKFPGSRVKFLLTTRPVPDILQLLTNGTILNMDEDSDCRVSLMGDIARVAQDRVEKFARERCIRDQATLDKLLTHLETQTNPSYLYTDLLFTYLDTLPVRPGTNYWSRTFDHLPSNLAEIYRALLDRIHESNRDDVRIMLEIVLAATKPLTLREMSIALALHIDDCSATTREDELGLPAEEFRNWTRDTCGVFFDVYNDRIYFTHQTVRDYLLANDSDNQRPEWLEPLSLASCHRTMAQSCFAYQALPFVASHEFLTIAEYADTPFYAKQEYHARCRGGFEFAEHAFAQWANHIRNAHVAVEGAENSPLFLDAVKDEYPAFQADRAVAIFCSSALPSSAEATQFLEMVAVDSPGRDDMITSLSQSLMARYCQAGDALDLQCGASLAESVLERTMCGHPQLAQRLAAYDQGLNMRFWDTVDHDVPITGSEMREAEKAVTTTPAGHPRRASVLHHRAAVLERQYQRTKNSETITQAIDDMTGVVEIVEVVAPSSLQRPWHLNYLANLLGQRFLDGGDMADLALAIQTAEEAVAATEQANCVDVLSQANHRSTLASWLAARYRHTKDPREIDGAIEAIRIALDVTTDDDPSRPIYLCSHARRMYERYEQTAVEEDLQQAIILAQKATDLTASDHPLHPFHRLFAHVLSTETEVATD